MICCKDLPAQAIAILSSDDTSRWPELVERIRRGDPAAEAQLSEQFYPRIVAMAVVRLGNEDIAREIAQETLLAVLPAVRNGKLREPEKLAAFVHGTARNLVNNHLRAASQRPNHVPLEDDTAAANSVTEMELEERRRIVREVLQRLRPIDRTILLLTMVDDLHPREIAARTGLSVENVRTRKMRAIKQVIAEIEKMSRRRSANPQGKE